MTTAANPADDAKAAPSRPSSGVLGRIWGRNNKGRSAGANARSRCLAAGVLLCVLGACVQPPEAPPLVRPASMPNGFPLQRYQAGYGPGGRVFRVQPAESVVTVRAYRGGRLASLGHNHTVSSRGVNGFLFWADASTAASRGDLYLPVAGLVVDEPGDRAAAGSDFKSHIPQESVRRTRDNMLGERVLDAARHPFVVMHVATVTGTPPDVVVTLKLAIRGTTRSYRIPTRIEVLPEAITASGTLDFKQSDFGIRPFAALGGALLVEDALSVSYRIYAVPAG